MQEICIQWNKDLYLNLKTLITRQLIKKCKREDPLAQKQFYDHFADAMFRLCYRYLKNEVEAEDAVVTGFTKIFQNFKAFQFKNETSLKAWVKKIMVNECLMILRSKNGPTLVEEDHLINHLGTHEADQNLNTQELYNLILSLPVGYRTVFNLYVIEGYTHQEIAKQLNISESTSKSQLSKARKKLQFFLNQQNELCYEARKG